MAPRTEYNYCRYNLPFNGRYGGYWSFFDLYRALDCWCRTHSHTAALYCTLCEREGQRFWNPPSAGTRAARRHRE